MMLLAAAGETEKPVESPKTVDWRAIVIACSAGIISLICSCVAMFVTQYWEKKAAEVRDKEQEELYQKGQIQARTPYGPLLEAMQQKDTFVRSLYAPSVLSESTMRRLGGTDAMLQRYQAFLRNVDAARSGDRQLMTLPQSLWPEVPVRRDTQVSIEVDDGMRYLNMNKLHDFIGEQMLIGQPPADRQQLDDHWDAIWTNKVGVIVWIGNVHGTGDPKMWFEAYAPVNAWKSEDTVWSLGRLDITVVESFIQRQPNSYYVHRIKITKKGPGRRTEERHLTIVHIDSWEDVRHRSFDWDPKPAFIKKLISALSYVHYRLLKKPKKAREIALPTLLVNCPSGVHQSVTFVVVYICRQMWMHKDKARVEAVLKYVRSKRYLAWGLLSKNELFSEIKIVYRTMKMIMNQLDEQKSMESLASRSQSQSIG